MVTSTDGSAEVPRLVLPTVLDYLDSFRVVVLHGPRQAGKTTLMRQVAELRGGEFRTLDREITRSAAIDDPTGFVESHRPPLYIDEVQRAGDALVRAVKVRVDEDNSRGQFVLAGSMRFLSTPSLQESLAGRAGVLEVWPFSQGEIHGTREEFLDAAFAGAAVRQSATYEIDRNGYLDLIVRGGFPEPARMRPRARAVWFDNYVTAIAERDIREMVRVREPAAAVSVLRALASISGQLLVTTKLAERAELARQTVDRYVALLEAVFLIHRLPSWSRNMLNRAVAHPKVHLVDTGLLAHLLGATPESLARPSAPALGQLVETFVVNEMAKQAARSESRLRLHHYRDGKGRGEVDLVVEDAAGRVVAVEAKAGSTVTAKDFRHLGMLRSRLGDDFVHGFVAHLGHEEVRFGDRLTAVPLAAFWS